MTNANKARPELHLDLDRRRQVKLDLRGMNAVEAATGRSFLKLVKWDDIGTRDLTFILWAGLYSDDPTLTFEKVEELFDVYGLLDNIPKLMEFAQQVIERCMPALTEEDRAAVEEQKKRVRQRMAKWTGSNSGPSDALSLA